MQLTPHFHLAEFVVSQAATRLGLRNEPGSAELRNLERLALVLEDVREALGGQPIIITSGYRSAAVNNAIAGAPASAHLDGRAADFVVPSFGTPRVICQRLMDRGIVVDQLIDERGWVHVGIAPVNAAPRGQLLTAHFAPGVPTRYSKGLLA